MKRFITATIASMLLVGCGCMVSKKFNEIEQKIKSKVE